MSKTVTANQVAALSEPTRRTAYGLSIQKANGEVFGFTDVNKDITLDIGDGNGPILYRARSGFIRSAIESSADFSPNNAIFKIALSDFGITRTDIRRQRLRGAVVRTFLIVDYNDLTLGIIKLGRSKVGKTSILNNIEGTVELLGQLEGLKQQVGKLITTHCKAELFDSECKVRSDPPVWTPGLSATVRPDDDAGLGTIVRPSNFNDRHFICTTAGTAGGSEPAWNTTIGSTTTDGSIVWTAIRATKVLDMLVNSVGDINTFTVLTSTDAPDIFLRRGTVTFTTGALIGQSFFAKSWSLTNKQLIILPFPREFVTIRDRLTVTAGCNKLWSTCRDTFNNKFNNRSEHLTPTKDYMITFPDAPQ
jgi:hypothetical protein